MEKKDVCISQRIGPEGYSLLQDLRVQRRSNQQRMKIQKEEDSC